MVSLRKSQKIETRQKIVAAGLRLVRESGFGKTTTGAIAREIGKAHGTVFVHFATREALVFELVRTIGSELTDRLSSLSDHDSALGPLLEAHLSVLADQEELYAAMLREMVTLPANARAYIFALQSGVAA